MWERGYSGPGISPGLYKKEGASCTCVALCLFPVEVMWPASSHSCCCDFPGWQTEPSNTFPLCCSHQGIFITPMRKVRNTPQDIMKTRKLLSSPAPTSSLKEGQAPVCLPTKLQHSSLPSHLSLFHVRAETAGRKLHTKRPENRGASHKTNNTLHSSGLRGTMFGDCSVQC